MPVTCTGKYRKVSTCINHERQKKKKKKNGEDRISETVSAENEI